MEKILLEIPDWAEERKVYIFLGRECFMVKDHDKKWYKKTVRCNLCGKCCKDLKDNWHLGLQVIDGETYCSKIKKVANQFWCEAGPAGPFSCVSDSPTGFQPKGCVLEYEEITT